MLTRRSISAGLTAMVLSGPAMARAGAALSPAWPGAAKAAVSLTYDDGLDSQLDNALSCRNCGDFFARMTNTACVTSSAWWGSARLRCATE